MKKEEKCQLCNSENILKLKLKKDNYNLMKCQQCELIFLNPIPKTKEIKEYYSNYLSKKNNKFINKEIIKLRKEKIWIPRYNTISKKIKMEDKSILEIGSGTGEWLEILKRKKLNYLGIEISPEEYKKTKINYNVINKSLLEFKNEQTYDIIFMWDLIEHLNDLNSNFNKINKLLNKNGHIIISTINTDSISFSLKKSNWRFFYPPEHIYYFNEKSLKILAKKENYKIIHYETKVLIQSYLTTNKKLNYNSKKIKFFSYKVKLFIEEILSKILKKKGEIIFIILEKK